MNKYFRVSDNIENVNVKDRRPESDGIHLDFAGIGRRWKRHLLCAILFAAAAAFYAAQRQPEYTASAQVLIENNQLQPIRQDSLVVVSTVDSPMAETQVRLFSSAGIALGVIDKLGLVDHNAFSEVTNKGIIQRTISSAVAEAKAWLGLRSVEPVQPSAALQRTLAAFQDRLQVSREGTSYVVNIEFRSPDPQEAARVVNAVVDVYQQQQKLAAASAAGTASAWLQDRLSQIGTRARIISAATPPITPNGPRAGFIVVVALMLGVLFSVATTILFQLLDRTVRTPEDVAPFVAGEFLGLLPIISKKRRRKSASGAVLLGDSRLRIVNPALRIPLDTPRSPYAHSLRHAEAAIRHVRPGKECIKLGITSTVAGEGKTMVALNLAQLMSRSGHRVLIIDSDSHQPTLTRELGLDGRLGFTELLSDDGKLETLVWQDAQSGVSILPIGKLGARPMERGLFLSANIKDTMKTIEDSYNVIIFDLPPMYPLADVRTAAPFMNAFLMVVASGYASFEQLENGLSSSGDAQQKIIGFLLNRAPAYLQKRYRSRTHLSSAYVNG